MSFAPLSFILVTFLVKKSTGFTASLEFRSKLVTNGYLTAKLRHNSRRESLFFFSGFRSGDFGSKIYCNGGNLSPDDSSLPTNEDDSQTKSRRKEFRKKISKLANNIVVKPIFPVPRAIASILKEAKSDTTDMQIEKVVEPLSNSTTEKMTEEDLGIEKYFEPVEEYLTEMENSLLQARRSIEAGEVALVNAQRSLQIVKDQVSRELATSRKEKIRKLETRNLQISTRSQEENMIEQEDLIAFFDDEEINVASLAYDDVGYHLCEMSPPFIDVDQCLVPGEAVVRVEKAPDNSRRIFAGIDIPVGVEEVWNLLTDYANLQNVVPNLAVNEVLSEFDGNPLDQILVDVSLSDIEQCESISKQLKGALLKQIGGAKIAGINFSARTTLEVREWPQGLPDFSRFRDEVFDGKDRDVRANDCVKVELERYRFPRPFALSALPSKDISMQSILDDDGEFRLYQGVWRMQPLPGCAPDGEQAMRLTYAVEVSPRRYLPVSLIEGRIVKDMCTNLLAIRDYLTNKTLQPSLTIIKP